MEHWYHIQSCGQGEFRKTKVTIKSLCNGIKIKSRKTAHNAFYFVFNKVVGRIFKKPNKACGAMYRTLSGDDVSFITVNGMPQYRDRKLNEPPKLSVNRYPDDISTVMMERLFEVSDCTGDVLFERGTIIDWLKLNMRDNVILYPNGLRKYYHDTAILIGELRDSCVPILLRSTERHPEYLVNQDKIVLDILGSGPWFLPGHLKMFISHGTPSVAYSRDMID